jgi:hypothetical protein
MGNEINSDGKPTESCVPTTALGVAEKPVEVDLDLSVSTKRQRLGFKHVVIGRVLAMKKNQAELVGNGLTDEERESRRRFIQSGLFEGYLNAKEGGYLRQVNALLGAEYNSDRKIFQRIR